MQKSPSCLVLSCLIISLCFLLAACTFGGKVGGACSYEEAVDRAKVTAVHQSFVELNNAHDQYQVELSLFATPPIVGDSYIVAFSSITQGSCTPIAIKSVEKIVTNPLTRPMVFL
jgi:hypothetical protein